MDALLEAVARKLGRSWTDIVEWLRDRNALADVEARISAGDIDGAIQGVTEAAEKFASDLHAAFVSAATKEAEFIDRQVPDALVRFDQTNHRAVAWAQQNQAELVQGLSQEQRQVVAQTIADGVKLGTNPREVARDLRASIGLTPSQAQAVASYRTALENGDLSNALARELGDGRYDATLRAAMRDGRSIPQSRIDAMVDRYRANFVAYRAENIARTDGLRAVHQGADEALQQAIARGDVDKNDIEQTWNHSNRARHPRKTHAAMNGQRRKFGEPFESGSGVKLRYPGDPDAPIRETIDCSCGVSTRLTG